MPWPCAAIARRRPCSRAKSFNQGHGQLRIAVVSTVTPLVSPEKPPTASPAVVFFLPLLLSLCRVGPPCQPPWLRREPSVGRSNVWAAPALLAGRRSFGPAQQQ